MDTIDITITATPGAGDTCGNKVWLVIVKLWVWLTSVKCKVTVRLCLLIICMGGAVPAEQYNTLRYSQYHSPGVIVSNGTSKSLKL